VAGVLANILTLHDAHHKITAYEEKLDELLELLEVKERANSSLAKEKKGLRQSLAALVAQHALSALSVEQRASINQLSGPEYNIRMLQRHTAEIVQMIQSLVGAENTLKHRPCSQQQLPNVSVAHWLQICLMQLSNGPLGQSWHPCNSGTPLCMQTTAAALTMQHGMLSKPSMQLCRGL
jgi:hypothetical protein